MQVSDFEVFLAKTRSRTLSRTPGAAEDVKKELKLEILNLFS